MLNLACALYFPTLPQFVVYHDDEDLQRYHVVTRKARLARRPDSVSSFSVVSTGGTGPAFISFTAELGVNAEDEAALRKLLADPELAVGRMRPTDPYGSSAGRKPAPIVVPSIAACADAALVPPLFTEGQALLVIGDPAAPLIEAAQPPSLFGSNTTSFSLLLEKGTAKLAEFVAADGPIGRLTYHLSFPARVPALHLTMEAQGEGPQEAEPLEAAISRGVLRLTAADPTGNPLSADVWNVVISLATQLWTLRPPDARSINVAPGEMVTCHLMVSTTLRELVPPTLWQGLQ